MNVPQAKQAEPVNGSEGIQADLWRRRMKLAVDANILLAAYLGSGRIADEWRGRLTDHRLYISPEIFLEFERTLRRSEFGLTGPTIRRILKDVLDRCEIVRRRVCYLGVLPDEGGRHLAELGVGVEADALLTEHQEIIHCGCVGQVPVWSVDAFLDRINSIHPAA